MSALAVLLFLPLGAVAGAAHFTALSREADLLAQGGRVPAVLILRLGRVMATATILAAAAWQGWAVLLAAFAGFMAGRRLVLLRLGDAA